jgi:hypothetical protein
MSYPNSDLAVWQLVLIAVVMLGSLAAWLILVYRAAREPQQSTVRAAEVSVAPVGTSAGKLGAEPGVPPAAPDSVGDPADSEIQDPHLERALVSPGAVRSSRPR